MKCFDCGKELERRYCSDCDSYSVNTLWLIDGKECKLVEKRTYRHVKLPFLSDKK